MSRGGELGFRVPNPYGLGVLVCRKRGGGEGEDLRYQFQVRVCRGGGGIGFRV